jgi:hypothetical protein
MMWATRAVASKRKAGTRRVTLLGGRRPPSDSDVVFLAELRHVRGHSHSTKMRFVDRDAAADGGAVNSSSSAKSTTERHRVRFCCGVILAACNQRPRASRSVHLARDDHRGIPPSYALLLLLLLLLLRLLLLLLLLRLLLLLLLLLLRLPVLRLLRRPACLLLLLRLRRRELEQWARCPPSQLVECERERERG